MTIGERVLQIATGELGVTEFPAGTNNVKYNTWFYGQEVRDGLWGTTFPWCMAFVQWCHMTAGYTLPYKTASCNGLLTWYRKNRPECIVTAPRAGDIIIYNFSHTGIVESVADGTITAIEGNTSTGNDSNGGAVMRRTRSKSRVTAYIRPFDGNIPAPEPEQEEVTEMRYNTIDEMPAYYRKEAQELMDLGALKGKADGTLDVSEDMLRTMIINLRATKALIG